MKTRKLKYSINWRDVWKKMRDERMKELRITYDDNFLERYTQDYSRQVKSGNYEFGRKAVGLLNILNKSSEVLEIGPGPGTLTIPLARIVRKVVGIEFSRRNIKYLKMNLEESGLRNVAIINKDWGKVSNSEIEEKFDIVVCSHFLWQVENIEELLRKMENAFRKYGVLIQPAGRDETIGKIFEKICAEKYRGQFEPDADYFAYVILREWGRLIDVRYFDYIFERDLEEEIRVIANFIGRFVEIDKATAGRIRDYLSGKLKNNRYGEKNRAVVMWWRRDN